jgi:hypothetical protein
LEAKNVDEAAKIIESLNEDVVALQHQLSEEWKAKRQLKAEITVLETKNSIAEAELSFIQHAQLEAAKIVIDTNLGSDTLSLVLNHPDLVIEILGGKKRG